MHCNQSCAPRAPIRHTSDYAHLPTATAKHQNADYGHHTLFHRNCSKHSANPQSSVKARAYARGSCTIQAQKKLIHVGVHMAPAPLKACVTTMPNANNTYVKEMILRHDVPTLTTPSSRVKMCTRCSVERTTLTPLRPETPCWQSRSPIPLAQAAWRRDSDRPW